MNVKNNKSILCNNITYKKQFNEPKISSLTLNKDNYKFITSKYKNKSNILKENSFSSPIKELSKTGLSIPKSKSNYHCKNIISNKRINTKENTCEKILNDMPYLPEEMVEETKAKLININQQFGQLKNQSDINLKYYNKLAEYDNNLYESLNSQCQFYKNAETNNESNYNFNETNYNDFNNNIKNSKPQENSTNNHLNNDAISYIDANIVNSTNKNYDNNFNNNYNNNNNTFDSINKSTINCPVCNCFIDIKNINHKICCCRCRSLLSINDNFDKHFNSNLSSKSLGLFQANNTYNTMTNRQYLNNQYINDKEAFNNLLINSSNTNTLINSFNNKFNTYIPNDPKLELVLRILDMDNITYYLELKNISFKDLLLLDKNDLIELDLNMPTRNRLKNFIQAFNKHSKNQDINEIINFFIRFQSFVFNFKDFKDLLSLTNKNNEIIISNNENDILITNEDKENNSIKNNTQTNNINNKELTNKSQKHLQSEKINNNNSNNKKSNEVEDIKKNKLKSSTIIKDIHENKLEKNIKINEYKPIVKVNNNCNKFNKDLCEDKISILLKDVNNQMEKSKLTKEKILSLLEDTYKFKRNTIASYLNKPITQINKIN